MSVGEWLGGLFGLSLLGIVLVVGLWTIFALARELLAALRAPVDEVRARLAERRRARLQAAERAVLERRHLSCAVENDAAPIVSAASASDLLVTGHADGAVRLRCLAGGGAAMGGVQTGTANGVRVWGSEDGALIGAAECYHARLTLLRADGAVLGTVSHGDSEAFRAWLTSADSLDGYLHLNTVVAGAAFGEAGGAVLTVAWDLRYGPDGGPGPVYGSAASLIRRYRLGEGAPRLLSEILRDLGRGPSPGTMVLPGGRSVIAGGHLVDAATGEVRRLPPEIERPLAATPDGRWLVGEAGGRRWGEPGRWVLWNIEAGEVCRVWEDATASAAGYRGAVSSDAGLFAVAVREHRRLGRGAGTEWTVQLTRVYDVASGRAVATLPVSPLHLAFVPGSALLTVEAEGVKIWHL